MTRLGFMSTDTGSRIATKLRSNGKENQTAWRFTRRTCFSYARRSSRLGTSIMPSCCRSTPVVIFVSRGMVLVGRPSRLSTTQVRRATATKPPVRNRGYTSASGPKITRRTAAHHRASASTCSSSLQHCCSITHYSTPSTRTTRTTSLQRHQ